MNQIAKQRIIESFLFLKFQATKRRYKEDQIIKTTQRIRLLHLEKLNKKKYVFIWKDNLIKVISFIWKYDL